MSKIVYTSIDSLRDLEGAAWKEGVQDSYFDTQKMAERCDTGIMLIGRRSDTWPDPVQVRYARTRNTEWREINGWSMRLARYLDRKLDDAPAGDRLNPFFAEIDDETARNAARQLVYLECGINASDDKKHAAVNRATAFLPALGVPNGDWTFIPVLAAAQK